MNREQRNILYIALAILGLTLAVFAGYQLFKPDKYLQYSSADGYSVQYPEGWVANREKIAGVSAFFEAPKTDSFDTFGENVNIVVQDLSRAPKSLGAYTETAMRQMKLVFNNQLTSLEEKSVYVDAHPGYKFIFVSHGDDMDIQIMVVWVLKDDMVYQITYTARADTFEDYSENVEKMISSFKFK